MINWPFVWIVGAIVILVGAFAIGIFSGGLQVRRASKELEGIESEIQHARQKGLWLSEATGLKKAILNRLDISDFDGAKTYIKNLSELYATNGEVIDVASLFTGADLSERVTDHLFAEGVFEIDKASVAMNTEMKNEVLLKVASILDEMPGSESVSPAVSEKKDQEASLYCESCRWVGPEERLVSTEDAPSDFVHCPQCGKAVA